MQKVPRSLLSSGYAGTYQGCYAMVRTENAATSSHFRHQTHFPLTLTAGDPVHTIPFITESIDTKKSSISTSIYSDLQEIINDTIKDSAYPVSIVILKDGKIVGINSTYGIDHPIVFRSNVGSALKPFLYCFYRANGISPSETFSCKNLTGGGTWSVKEAELPDKSELTLQEALLLSNNNTFINAANKIGMSKVLQFIADLLNKDTANIHPASILGATSDGISLLELTRLYADFFQKNNDPLIDECKQLLHQIAVTKLKTEVNNIFLKTGTTNGNKERFAILGNEKIVFGILRQENPFNDYTKDGGFISSIRNFVRKLYTHKNLYKWT